jgi:hypothetical protein
MSFAEFEELLRSESLDWTEAQQPDLFAVEGFPTFELATVDADMVYLSH